MKIGDLKKVHELINEDRNLEEIENALKYDCELRVNIKGHNSIMDIPFPMSAQADARKSILRHVGQRRSDIKRELEGLGVEA